MGLMLGGALANLVERWARGAVTDYVYLPRAVIPFFRRIIWNVADLSVFGRLPRGDRRAAVRSDVIM